MTGSMTVALFLGLLHFACPRPSHCGEIQQLSVNFSSSIFEKLKEGQSITVEYRLNNLEQFYTGILEVEILSSEPYIASIDSLALSYLKHFPDRDSKETDSFNLTGHFLGYTDLSVQLWGTVAFQNEVNRTLLAKSLPVRVAVIREPQTADQAFSYTIAALVSLAFVNMGCSLDLDVVKATLKKPIGPLIGFCCQYLFMPLCAYGIATSLLSHSTALQLGLFVTGCSPGGGGSNIWTYILGGNLNLSITMTCLSTLASFAMMPLWTLTLGRLVFTDSLIIVPYTKVATLAAGLAAPLLVGIAIRRMSSKIGLFLVKMLKPVAGLFILVIIGFGIFANLYMFQLMDWRVLLSGMLLPWLGYLFGAVSTAVLRQPWTDSLAIAVETGVQNTGIAIFILRFTLEQPAADINTVVPVAVALMTPVPLLSMWAAQQCYRRFSSSNAKGSGQLESNSPTNFQAASSVDKLVSQTNNNQSDSYSVQVNGY